MAEIPSFEHESPGWQAEGVAPSPETKVRGYAAGYKPPAGFFNWFWTLVSRCIGEIQGKFASYAVANEADKEEIREAIKPVDPEVYSASDLDSWQRGAKYTATKITGGLVYMEVYMYAHSASMQVSLPIPVGFRPGRSMGPIQGSGPWINSPDTLTVHVPANANTYVVFIYLAVG